MPGAGKSAALVSFLIDEAAKGRAIYADGVPDLKVPHQPLTDPLRWHEDGVVPDGAVIVIDEVQRVWRPAGATAKVPPSIEALETHRHRGLDFFIVTQHPSLVHANVRRLCGRYIHLRDRGILGRKWYEWPEVVGNPETSYKGATVQKPFVLPKKALGQYTSASIHIQPSRGVPWQLYALAVVVLFLGVMLWRGYQTFSTKRQPQEQPSEQTTPTARPLQAKLPPPVPAAGGVLTVGPQQLDREPYAGFGVHLVGHVAEGRKVRAWFALSIAGQRVGVVPDSALHAAGYAVTHVAPCVAVLRLGERERVAVCDAPREAPTRPTAPPAAASAVPGLPA